MPAPGPYFFIFFNLRANDPVVFSGAFIIITLLGILKQQVFLGFILMPIIKDLEVL